MKNERQVASNLVNQMLGNKVTKVDIAAEIGISVPTLYKRLDLGNWTRNEIFIIVAKFK